MKAASRYYGEAVELSSERADPDFLITCASQLAKSEANAGECDRAQATLAQAGMLLDDASNPMTLCEYEQSKGQMYKMMGDFERATACTLKSLETARTYDLQEIIARDAHTIGERAVEQGDYRKAFTYLTMSQEVAREMRYDALTNINNVLLAFIDSSKSESTSVVEQIEQAFEAANKRGTVWEQLHILYYLGRAHMNSKNYTSAKECLEKLIGFGGVVENRVYDAQAAELLSQIDQAV
jgi:tetratricopeptide (TPR) repeat protein